MPLQNLHTHTSCCDGQHSPEQMIQGALRLGMTSLGFSGHAPLPVFSGWDMTPAAAGQYRTEILDLRERYQDQIQIFLGLEQDYYSPAPPDWCEYTIGSVHQIEINGRYHPMDYTAEALVEAANAGFHGDIYGVIEAYYSLVGQIAEKTGCQILGHFDVICKNNEKTPLFDTSHPRYMKAAMNALEALSGKGLVFEINTGAMSRGYRTAPYPEQWLLRAMKAQNIPICITSDAHHADHLLHGFRDAGDWARSCGYRSCMYWNGREFYEDALP